MPAEAFLPAGRATYRASLATALSSPEHPLSQLTLDGLRKIAASLLQELVQPQHLKTLDGNPIEQESKIFVVRHENVCRCSGTDSVLEIARIGTCRGYFIDHYSVHKRHPKTY